MGLVKEIKLDLDPQEEQAYFGDVVSTDLLQPKIWIAEACQRC